MAKTISTTASARLKQDYLRLQRDPVPFITAEPLPSNILTWYYVVRGPENTPYHGGIYMGKLVFPREFPFKPPSIYMLTPNGRFKVNQKLCLSISDYHPDSWNPAWSVSTILTGLLSFMLETTPTAGSIESSEAAKRRFAQESLAYNLEDKTFCELFSEIETEIRNKLATAAAAAKNELEKATNGDLKNTTNNNNQATNSNMVQINNNNLINNNNNNNNRVFSFLGNFVFIVGFAAFALVVKYVFNTVN